MWLAQLANVATWHALAADGSGGWSLWMESEFEVIMRFPLIHFLFLRSLFEETIGKKAFSSTRKLHVGAQQQVL